MVQIIPPSIVKINDYTFDTDGELWDWYKRIKKLSPSLDMKTFYEIIHQPDFTIDGYEISKNISIENERDVDREKLQQRYKELMEKK